MNVRMATVHYLYCFELIFKSYIVLLEAIFSMNPSYGALYTIPRTCVWLKSYKQACLS